MNQTRLALIDGGLLVAGSGLLNFWVTYVKLNVYLSIPYPEALTITTIMGWLILIPAAFVARNRKHESNVLARVAVISGAFATLAGSMRVYAIY